MTKEEFRKLTENILILDGATGSNLMASGMPRGICTETWVIDHKDIIQDLQRAYIQAGSQVIYAPTFGGNSINLEKHGLRDKIEEINRTLVGYSKELAGSGIYVAGDITTSGSFITADGDYTYTEAYNMYQEQIRILADAGIDLIAAETMINIEETLAAVDAAASVCDLPIMCTMTVEADGSIFSGEPIALSYAVPSSILLSLVPQRHAMAFMPALLDAIMSIALSPKLRISSAFSFISSNAFSIGAGWGLTGWASW